MGKRFQGAWPASVRPTVTKGAVMRTPNAMLGTKMIPVASSRAYVMGANTRPAWQRTVRLVKGRLSARVDA